MTQPAGIENLLSRSVKRKIGANLPEDQRVEIEFYTVNLDFLPALKKLEKFFKGMQEGTDFDLDEEVLEAVVAVITKSTNLSSETVRRMNMDYIKEVLEHFVEVNGFEKYKDSSKVDIKAMLESRSAKLRASKEVQSP